MRLHSKGSGMLMWENKHRVPVSNVLMHFRLILSSSEIAVSMVNNCRLVVPMVQCISAGLPWHDGTNLESIGIIGHDRIEHRRHRRNRFEIINVYIYIYI